MEWGLVVLDDLAPKPIMTVCRFLPIAAYAINVVGHIWNESKPSRVLVPVVDWAMLEIATAPARAYRMIKEITEPSFANRLERLFRMLGFGLMIQENVGKNTRMIIVSVMANVESVCLSPIESTRLAIVLAPVSIWTVWEQLGFLTDHSHDSKAKNKTNNDNHALKRAMLEKGRTRLVANQIELELERRLEPKEYQNPQVPDACPYLEILDIDSLPCPSWEYIEQTHNRLLECWAIETYPLGPYTQEEQEEALQKLEAIETAFKVLKGWREMFSRRDKQYYEKFRTQSRKERHLLELERAKNLERNGEVPDAKDKLWKLGILTPPYPTWDYVCKIFSMRMEELDSVTYPKEEYTLDEIESAAQECKTIKAVFGDLCKLGNRFSRHDRVHYESARIRLRNQRERLEVDRCRDQREHTNQPVPGTTLHLQVLRIRDFPFPVWKHVKDTFEIHCRELDPQTFPLGCYQPCEIEEAAQRLGKIKRAFGELENLQSRFMHYGRVQRDQIRTLLNTQRRMMEQERGTSPGEFHNKSVNDAQKDLSVLEIEIHPHPPNWRYVSRIYAQWKKLLDLQTYPPGLYTAEEIISATEHLQNIENAFSNLQKLEPSFTP